MFIKNSWYVAAEPHEVGRAPFARTICNEPVVFWRTEEGTPVAFEDRCCHRRMPLRKGSLVGDVLHCHYHGLQFDASGACLHVPGQSLVPPGARVRTFPVVQKYNWIWVWMGDPALADETQIVPYPWKTSGDWGDMGTYFHVQADYRLIIDNLLDLSHLAFVHRSTIGNDAAAEAADTRVFRDHDRVTVARWIPNQPAPPTYQKAGGFAPDQLVDRWQIIEWRQPGFVRLFTGAAPGAAGPTGFGFHDLEHESPEHGISFRNLNAITPETETSCHYFWSQCQNIDPESKAFTDMVYRQIVTAFHQDWEVFEMQQANWDDRPVVDINGDAGPIAARQILDRVVTEERGSAAAEAAE